VTRFLHPFFAPFGGGKVLARSLGKAGNVAGFLSPLADDSFWIVDQ